MAVVLGFPIPARLEALIDAGIWLSEGWKIAFLDRSGIHERRWDCSFVTPGRMEAWMTDLREFQSEIGADALAQGFMVRSSLQTGRPVALPFVDMEYGLPLVDAHGEPWLWLDYRDGAEPVVLEFVLGPRRWVELASSFDELASRVQSPAPVTG